MLGTGETIQSEETMLSEEVRVMLDRAIEQELPTRIWEKDASVWSADEKVRKAIDGRLGWLDVSDWTLKHLDEISEFAEGVRKDGITTVVILGMGGSSLCVETLRDTFGVKEGYPKLLVLDSTHPDQILDVERACDLKHTHFIVASKSGTTLEPQCYFDYFWNKLESIGNDRRFHFAAITDPGTPLEKMGEERGFRRTFANPPDIGGRYSVLSYFGMVPAALAGIDIEKILSSAGSEAGFSRTEDDRNTSLSFGVFLGYAAQHGRDKLTIVTLPELASFGYWAEQLLAESTGKSGKGILPIEGESLRTREEEANHRIYAHLTLGEETLDEAERAKPAHIELHLSQLADLGAQFFRWEFATAVAGQMMGINPFDEPNVAESKAKTNEVLVNYDASKSLPHDASFGIDASTSALDNFLSANVKPDGYIALMAYLNRNEESKSALAALRERLSLKYHVPVTIGFGPRFLHSTGQFHKGGPATGAFVQFIDSPREDMPIPGKPYSFGTLIRAQAIGDFETLRKHGRPVVSFDLGKEPLKIVRNLSS
ncbi:MAG TPA: glucose-6-phosphate isomerase [Candidatus Kapabacteria bacterium]|nr:glucose-6-phosphate isomerase [Candidatus Kapabacteria bacterium]